MKNCFILCINKFTLNINIIILFIYICEINFCLIDKNSSEKMI